METSSLQSRRLSREEWLQRALQAVAAKGGAKLRIDRLVADLGVTKGSFYWHFQDRAHFVRCLADYWARVSTEVVIDHVASLEGPPKERLLALAEFVVNRDLARYDLAMRSWAIIEPEIAPIVRRVDRNRLSTVRGLLVECGFAGDDLETRNRIFVTYLSGELTLFERESRSERRARIRDRVEFLTRG